MDILFIGGSRFVGKHAVLAAVERGHRITLFNRGTQPLPAGGVRHIQGDRNQDLDKLTGESFDAVVDTSGYLPGQVRRAAEALNGNVRTFLFISTISVYADQETPFLDEEAELTELDDPSVEEVTSETYGGLKVLCERALEESFEGRRLVLRPCVIVGPDDPTDRFTYWPARMARGGEVLAPAGPDTPVQWIDARDLGQWMITLLEREVEGVYNAVSEADRFTFGELLSASQRESRSSAQITWASSEFLLEQGVKPFVDLPMWIPGERGNFLRIDGSRARQAGLEIRSTQETVKDTLEWHQARGQPDLKVGLDSERERQLLEEWRRR